MQRKIEQGDCFDFDTNRKFTNHWKGKHQILQNNTSVGNQIKDFHNLRAKSM